MFRIHECFWWWIAWVYSVHHQLTLWWESRVHFSQHSVYSRIEHIFPQWCGIIWIFSLSVGCGTVEIIHFFLLFLFVVDGVLMLFSFIRLLVDVKRWSTTSLDLMSVSVFNTASFVDIAYILYYPAYRTGIYSFIYIYNHMVKPRDRLYCI